MPRRYVFLVLFSLSCSSAPTERFDLIIRNGTIYDGSGSASYVGDVAIHGDRIAAIGDLSTARGRTEVDAEGLAVSPGFINVLSWAVGSLIEDGRSQGDIRQGVTLEVFGEGISYGPVNERVEQALLQSQVDIKFDIEWTTLGEYLDFLVRAEASPPMWLPSSAPPRSAFMRSDTRTAPRLPKKWIGCANWCARPWRKGRSESARH